MALAPGSPWPAPGWSPTPTGWSWSTATAAASTSGPRSSPSPAARRAVGRPSTSPTAPPPRRWASRAPTAPAPDRAAAAAASSLRPSGVVRVRLVVDAPSWHRPHGYRQPLRRRGSPRSRRTRRRARPAGASMTRSSPERNASAGAVIGSTASDAARHRGSCSALNTSSQWCRSSTHSATPCPVAGSRTTAVATPASSRSRSVKRVVEHGVADRAGHPEVVRRALDRLLARRAASARRRAAGSRPGRVSSQPSTGPGPALR